MAQRNYRERVADAHFSLGFFSFLRGGGTGASAPVALASFFTTFLTTFFLGTSAEGTAGSFATLDDFASTETGAAVASAATAGDVASAGDDIASTVTGIISAEAGGKSKTPDGSVSTTEDSICAAVVDLPLDGDLTPICANDTAPTGGVGTSGSSTDSACLS